MSLTRRGVTLTELLVALVLFGVLSLAVVGVMRSTLTGYRATVQGIDRRQNLRIAAAFLPAELRELDAADGDLVAMQPTAITLRAARQLGALCRDQPAGPAGSASLVLSDALRYGLRNFDPAGDSLWILAGADDDRWVRGGVTALGAAPCTDGRPGLRLGVALPATDGFAFGTPVLGFETVTYKLYRSSEDGRWYVGEQEGASLQPLLGPVTPNGLSFAYLDSTGTPTTDPTRVRLIEVRVRAVTVEPIRDASGHLVKPVDSLVTLVALRNNRDR
ncbi:MAG TPA: prepilin-type N-terminal cleavage/methylation domain-containing protein [Gemmatimonadales bacterium]|jgi:prepilin-type N-terminal cleavage/methylation domain-containing protein|nr:prepilin-type N-terminal cleavage/methylation domain-containing protein [Gemmatimonadales bacterium]